MIHTYSKTESKLSTVVIAFNAGARMESSLGFSPGIAHMLEHCIFKGTNERNAFEIQREIGFLGGSVNAFTSHEIVAYHVTVPYENLDLAMEIMSNIVFDSTFPEEEFAREREVVKEEEISRLDNHHSYMWSEFSNKFFDNYIGTPVIGTQDTISKFTRDEVDCFHKEYCKRGDAVVSLCSNLPENEAMLIIKRHFGEENGKISKRPSHPNSSYSSSEVSEINRPGLEHTYVWIGAPGVNRGSELIPATRIIMSILGGGMDSRLFTEVREKRGLVYGISSSLNEWECGSLSLISGSTRAENVDEMLSVISDEVEKVKTINISDEELQRAKNKMRASSYGLIESASGMAQYRMREKLVGLPSVENYMASISEITPEKVREAANAVFDNSKKLTMTCKSRDE
jgi:predicted Zn-dependent peptidase